MGHSDFIKLAIELALKNISEGGGPFGAVITKSGEVVAQGCNRVTASNDPTAHAEVVAIREACKKLGTFDLSGCTLYASCEPCPMCFSAIYWAHIDEVYYAATKHDAERVNFDDAFIYKELEKNENERTIKFVNIADSAAQEPFDVWLNKADKTEY